jgi:hypothetical protein
MLPLPLQMVLLMFAGWVNRQQLEVIEYLKEENRVLKDERGRRTPWSTFLKAHWESAAATDFFTVEVCTLRGSCDR